MVNMNWKVSEKRYWNRPCSAKAVVSTSSWKPLLQYWYRLPGWILATHCSWLCALHFQTGYEILLPVCWPNMALWLVKSKPDYIRTDARSGKVDRVTQSSFLLRLAYHTFQHSNLCCTTTEALIHELSTHHLLSSLSPGGKLVSSSSTPATWDRRTTHLRVHPISSKWANSVVYQDIVGETSTYTEGMNWSCSGGWFL